MNSGGRMDVVEVHQGKGIVYVNGDRTETESLPAPSSKPFTRGARIDGSRNTEYCC